MNKLRNADKDCEQLFADIGLTSTEVELMLAYLSFQDGTTSEDPIEVATSVPYAANRKVTGWTVADLFRFGFPPLPTRSVVNAISFPGNSVYLRPSAVTWQMLIHEALHQFRGIDDGSIMTAWEKYGVNPNGDSNQISDLIRKKCN